MHDEIFLNDSKAMNHSAFNGTNNVQTRMVTRKTNNAGGIEGGMTNGEDVIIRLSMKPIPTMRKPLNSINIKTKTEENRAL